MNKFSVFLSFLFVVMVGHSQPGDFKGFKMAGKKPVTTAINQTISQTSGLQLFGTASAKISGMYLITVESSGILLKDKYIKR